MSHSQPHFSNSDRVDLPAPPNAIFITTTKENRIEIPDGFQLTQFTSPDLLKKIKDLHTTRYDAKALSQLTIEFIAGILRGMHAYQERAIEAKQPLAPSTPIYVLLELPPYAIPAFYQAFVETGIGCAYYMHPKRFGRRKNYQVYLYSPKENHL